MSRLLKDYENQITQHYKKGKHNGVDLVGYKSKTCWIKSHSNGVVVDLKTNCNKTYKIGGSYGNYVKIKHDEGYYTLYGHLKYGTIKVFKNQKIKEGDLIGYMGSTGHSKGAHLHFEVFNEKNKKVNPEPYLNSDLPNKKWSVGEYEFIYSKAIRSDHTLKNNIVKVKECMSDIRPLLTSNKENDDAYFKVGVKRQITEIYIDKEKRVWGKLKNTWVVLCNKDGTPQVKKNLI